MIRKSKQVFPLDLEQIFVNENYQKSGLKQIKMKNKDLKYLETATIDELKSILNSISKNINVLSLDFSLTDDLMEGLNTCMRIMKTILMKMKWTLLRNLLSKASITKI